MRACMLPLLAPWVLPGGFNTTSGEPMQCVLLYQHFRCFTGNSTGSESVADLGQDWRKSVTIGNWRRVLLRNKRTSVASDTNIMIEWTPCPIMRQQGFKHSSGPLIDGCGMEWQPRHTETQLCSIVVLSVTGTVLNMSLYYVIYH